MESTSVATSLFEKLIALNVTISIVNDELKIKAPKGVLTNNLVEELKLHKEELLKLCKKKNIYKVINNVEKKEYYLLSSSQKRLFLLQQLDLNSKAYNMPYFIQIGSDINKESIEEVFKKLIARHESLRTSFHLINDVPVQRIHRNLDFKINEYVTDELNIIEEFITPFDLGQVPLIRVTILRSLSGNITLLIDMHHIITDGTSHSILEQEFFKFFSGQSLLPLRIQYRDFAVWHNNQDQKIKIKEQEAFWLSQFSGELPVLDLPMDFTRPTIQSVEGAIFQIALTKDETNVVRTFAKDNELTLFMSILMIYSILLSKLTGQEDIIIGVPIAGRRHNNLANIVGLFINTIAIRCKVNGEQTIKNFAESIRQQSLNAFENQDYPFEELVERVVLSRDLSRNPLFNVMFNMLNQSEYSGDLAEISGDALVHTPCISKFDLTLTAMDFGEQLLLSFDYCTKLFKPETIERFIGYFWQILGQLPGMLGERLCDVEIVSEKERRKLLYEFNGTRTNYPKDKTIHQLFGEQAQRTPDGLALIYGQQRLTYHDLDERSNQLAWHIRSQYEVRAKRALAGGTPIALSLERSLEMVVGILAVLKAGGAYVPMDTGYPQGRVDYILKDTGAELVLTQRHLIEGHPAQLPAGRVIPIDLTEGLYTEEDPSSLPPYGEVADLAYIIFTSGSTGIPKGVPISHGNFCPLAHWGFDAIGLLPEDRVLQSLSYYFDWSVWEIFIALTSGSSLYIVPKELLLDPMQVYDFITANRITILHGTPSWFNAVLQHGKSLESLRMLIPGAEKLTAEMVTRFISHVNPHCRLFNMYGPTEGTIMAAVHEIDRGRMAYYQTLQSIPIGTPIANSSLIVLDKGMNLCPVNIPGELYISGDGLSAGYLNDEVKTQGLFIPNAFKEMKGDTLYKTGDLARWLPDGSIEFLDRIDHQVKIRGFRIELGEIENALLRHKSIREAIVIAREDNGEKFLCAYIVSEEKIDTDELRTHLAASLPDYMLPSTYMELEKLPLNSNGKVDRRALPSPERRTGSGYVAPSNAIEAELVKIWSEVLAIPIDKLSVTDNFFAMGGHSLKATVLVSRIHRQLGVRLPLSDVFQNPTVSEQAKQLGSSVGIEFVSIPKSSEKTYYALSSAQKRIYVLQEMDPNSTTYNMPYIISLSGGFDKSKIGQIIKQLILRHESFRTSFIIIEDEPVQYIHKSVELDIQEIRISQSEVENLSSTYVKPFNLSEAPLIRVMLVNIIDSDSLLFIDTHHIINDGVSQAILEREFLQLYRGGELEPLRLQYKDYSEWQNSQNQRELVKAQETYWLNRFSGELVSLNLPTDHSRPVVQSFDGKEVSFALESSVTAELKAAAVDQGLTLYMVLLSSYAMLLSKLSGQDDIVIGTPIAGRRHADLEGVVGMFVSSLAMRISLNWSMTVKAFIEGVKQSTLEAFENQDYPFENLVDRLSVVRDVSRNPVFDVMINLLNQSEYRRDLTEMSGDTLLHTSTLSKFDLTLTVIDYGEQLLMNFNYCSKLFEPETIERFIGYFQQILGQLPRMLGEKLSDVEIVSEKERRMLLYEFNETTSNYSKDKTIHQLFQEQAQCTPEHIAIVYEGQTLTYQQVNEKSNQLARHIRAQYKAKTHQELKADTLIALYLERSLEMIIGIQAVLKAGGAYVPMDTSYPQERIDYMLEDTGAELILSQKNVIEANRAQLPQDKIILIDLTEELFNIGDTSNLPQHSNAKDLAYVIYTSGTTGRPKGAMLNHTGIVNRLEWMQAMYPLTSEDVVLQKTPYVFDVSVWELLWAHWYGAIIVLAKPEGHKDSEYLHQLIEKSKVTTLHFVPSMLDAYNQYLIEQRIKLSTGIKQIFCSGEALNKNVVEQTYQNSESKIFRLHNLYGPTEASVDVTYFETSPNSDVYIGRPIDNTQVYILDSNKAPVPIGVIGELYLGGIGLSRGYLKRPELTAERFVPNPFATATDKANGYDRLYKTGDLVRWMPDGNIEYLGRNDDQIKIRGFRIELGEIEQALSQVPCIKQFCVLAKERKTETGSNKYLAGYYVANKDSVEERANFMMDHYKEKILDNNLSFYMLNKDLSAFTFRKSELEFLYRELFQSNTYSSHISINSGDIIFDVGANIGIGSLFFAQQADDLTIYSFEPIGNLYDVLIMNLFIYSQKALFKTFNCGIGAENQNDVKFSFFRNNTVISSQYPDLESDSKLMANYLDTTSKSTDNKELVDLIIESQEEVTCQIRTISTIIREEKIKRIDLLKIDVEKAEMDVLNGIEEQDWDKICQIVIEVHDKNNRLEIIKNILENKGYTVYAQQDTDLQNSELYIVYAIRKSIDTVADKKDEKTLFDNNVITELLKTYKGWKGNGNLDSTDMLYEHLKTTLPEYMIPSIFIRMESFPLTVNGKLDKRALPDPDFSLTAQEYVAPTNEKEAEICKVWQDILGLDRVGITDNFFKIGGNSILAIQASHRMSKALECDIRVADIFRLKSIDKLLAVQDQYFELVKPYNFNYRANLPDMIFISPGLAGSEMYQNMAESIAAKYNCIGIDNYNLHSNEKIDSLNKLANHYLLEYEKTYTLKEPVNLLGWSLGGQIALEMAVILEARGYKNINVILLDTYLRDEKMRNLISSLKRTDDFVDSEKQKLISKFGPEYVGKISLAKVAEDEISNTPISNSLKYSNITLFKAVHEYEGVNTEDAKLLFEHYKSLKSNNIELVAENIEIITLDCNHFNLIDSKGATVSDFLLSKMVLDKTN